MKGRITQQAFWAVCGGVALTFAFDGVALGFCAWFALALMILPLRDATMKESFYIGLLSGFVHFLSLLYWLVPTMHLYGPLPIVISIVCLLLLAFYLALYISFFSMTIVFLRSRPGGLLLIVPALWVSFEYLRSYLFTGFPWGLIGYSQYHYLYLIQISDLFGVYGVSFFLGLVNAALLLAILHLGRARWQGRLVQLRPAGGALVCALVVILMVAGYGKWRLDRIDREIAAARKSRIAVVQGNIEQSLKWDESLAAPTTEKYISLSERIAPPAPDLVVWPETALPFYLYYDKELTERVLTAIDRMNTNFLVGCPSYAYDPLINQLWLFNSAYMINPEGRVTGKYDKSHLVPFGEYVPLKKWLPFVGKMVPQIGDFFSGPKGHLLSISGMDIGVQICYEVIFPDLSAQMIRNGGELIVNITNDAWFGRTAAPRQHFSMALFRAVENRRTLVRAANTGISAFADPAGRVLEASPLFQTRVMTREVPIITGKQTFYTANGDLLPAGCLAAALLLTTWAIAFRLRARRRQ